MAYHMLPSRGLVFASMPTQGMSIAMTSQTSEEDLMLCPDAAINQAMIEYEGWLQNTISALRGPLKRTKGPQSHVRKMLIEEITLATKDLHAAKREEWSCQLAAMRSQARLPSLVIDNQCSIVDGGQSHFYVADKRYANLNCRLGTTHQGNFSM
jgi:hypothetical protein